jgi:hypothetical protein
MIVPGDINIDTSTDDEILAAYLEMGFSEGLARTYLAVVRGLGPEYEGD